MEIILNNPYLLTAFALSIFNFVLGIGFFWQFHRYRVRQKALLQGAEISNLEELVLKHKKLLASHNNNLTELGKILAELVDRNKQNIQRVGLVRYNPFNDTGGNMSFAIALLDAKDNGIVISSLHGREGTRLYAKSIQDGSSTYRLTDEEKQAIESAKNNQLSIND